MIIPQRALLKIREYTFSSIFCCPSANRFFSPFFQHMKINTAVKKTTYTIKNPSLLADPVTLLLPIKISKIYDKSTVQPCQVIGKPHPNPYFFCRKPNFLFIFSHSFGLSETKISCKTVKCAIIFQNSRMESVFHG